MKNESINLTRQEISLKSAERPDRKGLGSAIFTIAKGDFEDISVFRAPGRRDSRPVPDERRRFRVIKSGILVKGKRPYGRCQTRHQKMFQPRRTR